MDTTKMAQASDEMSTYNQKGDYSIVPLDMWYSRAWTYQGMIVSEALNIIWEGMLICQIRKLMRYFCWVLWCSLSVWRSFGTSLGVKESEGMYVWVGK